MNYPDYIMVALTGLAVGSFLNVVIYRLPLKRGFFLSRSVCPKCSNQLKWYHNIPVISYLALGGKCAFCKARISVRYPLVELMNCLLYLYFFRQFGLSTEFFVYSILSSVLIVVFFIDLDHMIIPDSITLPGIVLGLAVSLLPGQLGIVDSLIGLVVGGGSLWLVAILGDWLFKKESMGGGDIKLTAMLGTLLGWKKILLIFISSAVIGLVVSIVIMAFSSKLRRERMIPFGPFIALAALLAICYGEQIIRFYVNNFLRV
ncbi:MAG: prepilin peptidase [Candidatus Zixiibacteriota bacterium]